LTKLINKYIKLLRVEHAVRGTRRFIHNLSVTRRFVQDTGLGVGCVNSISFTPLTPYSLEPHITPA